MTLSPVFRSADAIQSLRDNGYLEVLDPFITAQRNYQNEFYKLLGEIIAGQYIDTNPENSDDIGFLQEHFFLILFDMAYKNLGCSPARRFVYGQLNLAVKGIITSADNLFDGDDKKALPLALGKGQQFSSIMQLLCCDQLMSKILEKHGGGLGQVQITRILKDILSQLASIGQLEGSEETGIDTVLPVPDMLNRVHRIRGGKLFSLAFIAPKIVEDPANWDGWGIARLVFERLGTAFQIVDDIVDFEFDLMRKRHNILSAQIVHHGTSKERATFRSMQNNVSSHENVEILFSGSAQTVLNMACEEASLAFKELAKIGFCFKPADAEFFVQSIAGGAGTDRIKAVASG